MQDPKKKRLNAKETKKLIPLFKQFNKVANFLISGMVKEIEKKEKNIQKINVIVGSKGLKVEKNYNISIQAMDMNEIKVNKKDAGSYKKKLNWEDDFRNKNKGIIL